MCEYHDDVDVSNEMSQQGLSKPSGLKPPTQLPKFTQSRPLGELQDSSTNARGAMAPPMSNKHKPSGCNHASPHLGALRLSLTHAVPEPATKQRKTLAERAT